jgi:hypothetical protein
LLQLHEGADMAQLVFNRKMCSEGGVLVGQKRWERENGVDGTLTQWDGL